MRFALKTLFILCLLQPFAATALAGEWRKQPSGTMAWLHAIYFLDAKRGWIAGSNGTLLTTTDGGESWKIAPKPSEDNLRDVFFADEKNGWLLADRDIFKLKSPGEARSILLRTTDGGLSWERTGVFPISKTVSPQFTRLLVSEDRTTVWVIGEMGSLYRLENEQIWQKQAPPTRFLLRGGAIFNQNEAVLIGAGATILHTADGGSNWREARVWAGENARFNSVFFATRSLGWAVGVGGRIFASFDGGKTWRGQNSPVAADLFDVRFVTPNEGWAVGDGGALLHTTNSGNTWTQEKINTTHRLERIVFIGHRRGFAVGFGGTILTYTNEASPRPRLATQTNPS
ncbi:MAG: YCF48-related protein [Acidobacteriota bacterium]|nr:YCF48-related protein [Acidobacteriota bacterium]